MKNLINISLLLSLLSLFFLTGCKDDDNEIIEKDDTLHTVSGYSEDGLKKSYIYHDFTRTVQPTAQNAESCKYRLVYPLTIRIKADGKLVTLEKKFELFLNDTNSIRNGEHFFFIAAASSGVDLDAEIDFSNPEGNFPVYMKTKGLYEVKICDDFFHIEGDRIEGDEYWLYPNNRNIYETSYCNGQIKTRNLTTMHLDKVKSDDKIKTRQFEAAYNYIYPSEVYERTPEGEKRISIDTETEKGWKTGLYFALYAFGTEVTSDNWPKKYHFAHYY